MGQSLADAAVSGTSMQLDDEKRKLLADGNTEGLLAFNRKQFGGFTMELKDDADDDADDGDDDGDDDEEEDDEDDDEDDKPSAADQRIQELSAEAKKKRLRIKSLNTRIAELEAENAKLKKGPAAKSKDEDGASEEDDSESAKLKEENAKLQEKLVAQQLRTEFNELTTGSKALANFKNPRTAFKLLDLDEVEIDEEGIHGLDEAIKALVKSDPYLLDDGKGEKDEDDDEDKPSRRTGQPAGGNKRKKRGNPNREVLINKYPALRR